MHRLRTHWGIRLVALCMGVSLIPSLLAPVAQAAQPVAMPFADWLRRQVRVQQTGEAFEQAVAAAEARGPRSLQAFLRVFVEAYEAKGRDGSELTAVFTEEDLSDEALILYLQRRYQRVMGDAVLPRAALTAAAPAQAKTPQRPAHAFTGREAPRLLFLHEGRGLRCVEALSALRTVQLRSSAQPLGP